LCSNVRFRSQPSLGYCSGFLVAPNAVGTAGHCLADVPCTSTKFVFGFTANASGGGAPTTVPADNVYQCVSATTNYPTADWALAVLDRPVTIAPPMNLRYTGQVAVGDPMTIIGYPYGMPEKISPPVS
jgi:V8-like Glu-specific endopeptidase